MQSQLLQGIAFPKYKQPVYFWNEVLYNDDNNKSNNNNNNNNNNNK